MTQKIFDRKLLRLRRARARGSFAHHDFLPRLAAARLVERLCDVRRHFPLALDLGGRHGLLGQELNTSPAGAKIDRLVTCGDPPDVCDDPLDAAAARHSVPGWAVACCEERLPFAAQSFDLVLSAWNLHLVNDLAGSLREVARVLRPDGLFLASLPGEDSLIELRRAFLLAETELRAGAAPRVIPFLRMEDAATLLQSCGFTLPVLDCDQLQITYTSLRALCSELRAWGESNPLVGQRPPGLTRAIVERSAKIALEHSPTAPRVSSSWTLLFIAAWTPPLNAA